ncbi:hypothetical protein R1sor_024196 [Riccia sorocarpa]|uniref:Uncharacterized protein n=1 Tax=Riccia sorocarpa TaxID=122646 RepID=A0ABD3GPT4_9MARC
MTLNLLTPSLRTVKRSRSKFVPFLPGLQISNFQEVNNIFTAAKQFHGIECDVPVILVEDETRVKQRVRWEPRRDISLDSVGRKSNMSVSLDSK